MIKILKNIFAKPESLENIKTPKNVKAVFELHFKDLPIGYLSLNEGEWTFKY
ncbi:MAG TPA: hypothetical protein PKA90_13700 [Ignavibacteria bacterium]|nr:hypothetical protein [Ignavibacteria bacterium]HMR41473.1 hypothetical protein [Ignavibacteria bacterium]